MDTTDPMHDVTADFFEKNLVYLLFLSMIIQQIFTNAWRIVANSFYISTRKDKKWVSIQKWSDWSAG